MPETGTDTLAKADTAQALEGFGAEVRELRKARRMTLSDLAHESGVSVSHISAIERGTVNASLEKVERIATGLGVPVEWFCTHRPGSGPLERRFVVRREHRRKLNMLYGEPVERAGYTDELLSSSIGGGFYLGISEYAPHSSQIVDQYYTRDGEMHGFVLKGRLELQLEKEVITVRSGDSFSFPGRVLHTTRNTSDEKTTLIWVNSPVIIPKFAALETAMPRPPSKRETG